MKRSRTMPLKRSWVKDWDLYQRFGKQLPDRQRFTVKAVLLIVKDFTGGDVRKPCEVLPESDFEAVELSRYVRAMNRLAIFGERGF